MSFEATAEALSYRRSSDRARVMIVMRQHRVMHPNELAHACRMDATRVNRVIFGRPPYYRVERSPYTLGWIVVVATKDGDVFAITPKGLGAADRLAAAGPDRRGRRDGLL